MKSEDGFEEKQWYRGKFEDSSRKRSLMEVEKKGGKTGRIERRGIVQCACTTVLEFGRRSLQQSKGSFFFFFKEKRTVYS